jgi:hypothetical protein
MSVMFLYVNLCIHVHVYHVSDCMKYFPLTISCLFYFLQFFKVCNSECKSIYIVELFDDGE